ELFKLSVNRGKKLRVRLLQPCDITRFHVNASGSVWIGIYRKSRKLKVLNGLVFLRRKANGGTQKFFSGNGVHRAGQQFSPDESARLKHDGFFVKRDRLAVVRRSDQINSIVF